MLEARFHPEKRGGREFVVVAHLVWAGSPDGQLPIVQPFASSLPDLSPATMLSKLRYLVSITSPESFQGLQTLRSQYWSFVEVPAEPAARTMP